MKYTVQEQLAKVHKDAIERKEHLGDLYIECETYEEFRIKSALNMSYKPFNKWLDKFWWHYLIVSYGTIIILGGFNLLLMLIWGIISISLILLFNLVSYILLFIVLTPLICLICTTVILLWNENVSSTAIHYTHGTIGLYEKYQLRTIWSN